MTALKQDLALRRGTTFTQVVRWETEPFLFATVSAMTNTAPARVTAAAHGLPNGWRAAVVGAKGLTQLNAKSNPPGKADFRRATVVDASTVEFNPLSAAEFGTYTGGGYLQFYTPHPLAGFIARMHVKSPDGTLLLALTTENGGVALDDAAKTITLTFTVADTEGVSWKQGAYDLELESAGGVVTTLMYGSIKLTAEITTPTI